MADSAADVARWIRAIQAEMAEHKDRLTELDAAIGDADHGTNMDRGMRAVVAKLDSAGDVHIAGLFKTVGMTLVSTVGGAAGPLYGTLFLRMGAAVGERSALDAQAWAAVLEAGLVGVQDRGKAVAGDKTMVDALLPAVAAFRATVDRGGSVTEAWHRAAVAARAGVKATIPMVARKGRASYLGERSAGHQDPGATSSYLLVECGAEVFGSTRATIQ